MLKAIEHFLTFKPNSVDHGGLKDLKHERVRFGSGHGLDLDGLWIPSESPTTVLFIHGNRHNITRFRDHYDLFHGLGISCFTFDFPGYGASKGVPSETSVYASAQAALEHICEFRGIPARSIAIYGCSLGGAVAIELARNSAAGCLITESTFTNSAEIARYLYPYLFIRHFLPTRFASDSKIASINMPKLFIHGEQDQRVPASMSRSLYTLASDPKDLVLVESADHVDCLTHGGEKLRATIGAFIAKHC